MEEREVTIGMVVRKGTVCVVWEVGSMLRTGDSLPTQATKKRNRRRRSRMTKQKQRFLLEDISWQAGESEGREKLKENKKEHTQNDNTKTTEKDIVEKQRHILLALLVSLFILNKSHCH